jgi:hypothetical protein
VQAAQELIQVVEQSTLTVQAAQELIQVVEQSRPSTAFAQAGHNQLKAIQCIADIFH